MHSVMRLGLTGGIGSGKSTVAHLLTQQGAALIDADALSRATTAAHGSAIKAIEARFGSAFITPLGELDRARMRTLVYQDASARHALESIVHPLVQAETTRQTEIAIQAGMHCIVYDVPLLVEAGRWRSQLDMVLVVDCPPELQIDRVMLRSGLTRTEIENIMASQASRTQRLKAADVVIFNGHQTLDELAGEVRHISHRFGL
ncbi:MAG: dephospho-CoA kinase [Gammaproteobacteria bacterium]|nr:dephospho-CoA kinase [Gammaproteobacteria bacterium]MBU0785675.1 dephospho-CoA kinase [Gammaproteobacteria bacterium]MBU0813813.1 dephospho-CoA kinase [Gammaproteobacteria bacterium]MBU1788715.1 dephospho-CoA kinase [Gammaproteobacteria bacterium]